MEGNKRQSTRPSQWGHQRQSFTPTTQRQQSQSGPSVNTPSLDKFLSGINEERNRDGAKSASNYGQMINASLSAPRGIHQRPPPPGLPQPGSMQWDSFTSANEKSMWQILPPGFGAGQMQPVSTQSKHRQDHAPLGSRQNNDDTEDFDVRDSSNCLRSAASFPHRSETANSQRTMQQFPVRVDTCRPSTRQQYHREQHNLSSFSEERSRPPASSISNEHQMGASGSGTKQPQTNFQGHHFPGAPPPPDKPFIPHFQQNQEPQPPGPRPSRPHLPGPHLPGPHLPGPRLPGPRLPGPHLPGPHLPGSHLPGSHPFGQPREFGFPPPTQPFLPHQDHQEDLLGSNFPRPHPVVPHPIEPLPPGSHHLWPHPSNPIQSGPPQFPPIPPALQQLQQGVAHEPCSPESNNLAPPKLAPTTHHQSQLHNFVRPSPHPQQLTVQQSQRDKDEDWLKDWMRTNKIGQSERTREKKIKSISVDDGRQLVVELLQALRQLSDQKEMLSRHINRDESMWQYECRRINRSKERVEMLQARLFSKEVTVHLLSKMKKISKKRKRLKRRRLENYRTQEDEEARRKKINLKIDAELAKRLHAEQEKKREADLQEDVDKTLYEVRKKKQDVTQTLDLIKGLRKLRQLRKDTAQAKGVYTPRQLDIDFDEKLKPLEELMSKQSVLYREEERVMQVMLEEEHEEYKEQEKRRQKKRLEEKAIREMRDKMKLLFGKDDLARPDDPMFHFHQFYHQADYNVHALLDIRCQWDQFLVPNTDPEGSPVPVSWVLPSDPSSSAWTSILDALPVPSTRPRPRRLSHPSILVAAIRS